MKLACCTSRASGLIRWFSAAESLSRDASIFRPRIISFERGAFGRLKSHRHVSRTVRSATNCSLTLGAHLPYAALLYRVCLILYLSLGLAYMETGTRASLITREVTQRETVTELREQRVGPE